MRKRSLRGGNASFKPVPVETYGYEYGGSESENAVKMLTNMSDKQNELNNVLSGGKRKKLTRGGSNTSTENEITIPQFPPVGPQVSNQTANSASLQLNSVLINAMNDATNDGKISTQSGGKRLRNKISRKMKKNKKSYKKVCKTRRCIKLNRTKTRRHRK